MNQKPRVLFCNCSYAQVVPKDVKQDVLKRLCTADIAFDAVGDLCEMSARRDKSLERLSKDGSLKVVACYPRAVKWLFGACGFPLDPASVEIINMRTLNADEVWNAITAEGLTANVPPDNKPEQATNSSKPA